MESIYKNSPELDSNDKSSNPTQQVSLAPTIESKPISQSHKTTIEHLTEPTRAEENSTQPDHAPTEQPSKSQLPIESITRQQQEQIIKTASRFLHLMGLDVWDSDQGYYHLMTNRKDLLVIRAKDHRGEILRYQGGKITNQSLTNEDVEKFQKINTLLDQKLAELSSRQLDPTRQPESELEL